MSNKYTFKKKTKNKKTPRYTALAAVVQFVINSTLGKNRPNPALADLAVLAALGCS